MLAPDWTRITDLLERIAVALEQKNVLDESFDQMAATDVDQTPAIVELMARMVEIAEEQRQARLQGLRPGREA
jgi:hypothetical protein